MKGYLHGAAERRSGFQLKVYEFTRTERLREKGAETFSVAFATLP
jgi:hypothetical protein